MIAIPHHALRQNAARIPACEVRPAAKEAAHG